MRRNLFTELASASRPQAYETIKWLCALTIGSFLPIWGGWLLLELFSQDVSLGSFARQGEFALYSAAFIMPALYIVGKDTKNPFVHRQVFMLVGVPLLLISALLFSAVVAAGAEAAAAEVLDADAAEGIAGFLLDRHLLVRLSLTLCAFSLLYAALVNLLDNILVGIDVSAAAAADQAALTRDFNALGDDNEQH